MKHKLQCQGSYSWAEAVDCSVDVMLTTGQGRLSKCHKFDQP